ncbi:hypothetical protein [Sphingomonas quercus]|uniref:GlsB/YeaQ/YmgE family stress response membrane protein n=1 Tax=Sphingomonas quercus TaxID=2842451 RepID=A0ABS6BFW5_9SPHN|nr:hypothetical protein [Sphingomonas quercus]MBU3076371.1 hypothetical protein [Sphingomonas quercus]
MSVRFFSRLIILGLVAGVAAGAIGALLHDWLGLALNGPMFTGIVGGLTGIIAAIGLGDFRRAR